MTAEAGVAKRGRRKPAKPAKKRVKFQVKTGQVGEVYVAGTFNDWQPNRNKLTYRSGAYSTSLLLMPGKYEYKFVIDGAWCIDPECADWVANDLGSLNSVMAVD
jgi:1,4-alpha-glucan branching enzyme